VGLRVGVVDARAVGLLGLGLPIEREVHYDFGFLGGAGKPVLVVQGENDEFGPGPLVAEALAPLGPHITLVRVPGADHYFTDKLDELKAAVRGYYESGPGAVLLADG
jgi:alpha/beta superfamily hydrolase